MGSLFRQGTTVSEQIAQMNATKNLLSRGGDSDDGPSFKPQFTPQVQISYFVTSLHIQILPNLVTK